MDNNKKNIETGAYKFSILIKPEEASELTLLKLIRYCKRYCKDYEPKVTKSKDKTTISFTVDMYKLNPDWGYWNDLEQLKSINLDKAKQLLKFVSDKMIKLGINVK